MLFFVLLHQEESGLISPAQLLCVGRINQCLALRAAKWGPLPLITVDGGPLCFSGPSSACRTTTSSPVPRLGPPQFVFRCTRTPGYHLSLCSDTALRSCSRHPSRNIRHQPSLFDSPLLCLLLGAAVSGVDSDRSSVGLTDGPARACVRLICLNEPHRVTGVGQKVSLSIYLCSQRERVRT